MTTYSLPRITYFAVLGATHPSEGKASVLEVGPFGTSTEALQHAASLVGQRAGDIPTGKYADHDTAHVASMAGAQYDDLPMHGFTIERYDTIDEETDGTWSLNGGIHRRVNRAALSEVP